jgi:hypothetical protein
LFHPPNISPYTENVIFSIFRKKSLFPTGLELSLPDEKAPNEIAFLGQKISKKKSYDFFGRFHFRYKVIFWCIFGKNLEKMTLFGAKSDFFWKSEFRGIRQA